MSNQPHVNSFLGSLSLNQGLGRNEMYALFPRPLDPCTVAKSSLVRDMYVEHARRTNTPIIFISLEAP